MDNIEREGGNGICVLSYFVTDIHLTLPLEENIPEHFKRLFADSI